MTPAAPSLVDGASGSGASDRLRRLGAVYPASGDPAGLADFARRLERIGLGQLWVVEDCFFSSGVALAATALAVTTELRVGIGLLPVPLRNPALAAMEIATLEKAHPGRFTATFGHGVRSWMQQVGAAPTRRLRALEETVVAVRSLLSGEAVTTSGEYVRLQDVVLEAPPAAAPDVLIGTTGPRGLELAHRVADGVLLNEGCGPEFVRWAVGAGSGRPASRCVTYAWLSLDDDPDVALERLAPALRGWATTEMFPFPRELAGLPAEPTPLPQEQLAAVAERTCAAGDPAACAQAIASLHEAGASDVILMPQGPDPVAELERVAGEVAPLLRR